MAADAVVGLRGVVAVDEAGGGEAAFLGGEQDAVHGAQEAGVVGGDEEDQGGDEDGGVEGVAALVGLHEALEGLAVACGEVSIGSCEEEEGGAEGRKFGGVGVYMPFSIISS